MQTEMEATALEERALRGEMNPQAAILSFFWMESRVLADYMSRTLKIYAISI